MNNRELRWWKKIRENGNSRISPGQVAIGDLRDARIIAEFERWESAGLVRLCAEPDQENYWSVFGESDSEKEKKQTEELIESWGCHYVYSEWRPDADSEWELADGVGMCIYADPLDPLQNCYIVDLMDSALDYIRSAIDDECRAAWGELCRPGAD